MLSNKFKYVSLFLFFPLLLLILNCERGGSSLTGPSLNSVSDQSSGTGSVTFKLMAPSLDCTAAGISTVEATVYTFNGGQSRIATGGPWSCTAHSGAINNIPAGSNLAIVILGKGANDVYRGEVTGITITNGVTTDAGTITLSSFAPTLLSPANGSTVSAGSITFTWSSAPGASKYLLQIYTSSVTLVTVDVTTTSYTYTLTSPGQYYWFVQGMDNYGDSQRKQNWILNVK